MHCCIFSSAGEALMESHTVLDFVYCSPSLRCVQTAHHILRGTSQHSTAPHGSSSTAYRHEPTDTSHTDNDGCFFFLCPRVFFLDTLVAFDVDANWSANTASNSTFYSEILAFVAFWKLFNIWDTISCFFMLCVLCVCCRSPAGWED